MGYLVGQNDPDEAVNSLGLAVVQGPLKGPFLSLQGDRWEEAGLKDQECCGE